MKGKGTERRLLPLREPPFRAAREQPPERTRQLRMVLVLESVNGPRECAAVDEGGMRHLEGRRVQGAAGTAPAAVTARFGTAGAALGRQRLQGCPARGAARPALRR